MTLYTRIVSALVLALARFCLCRGRYVDYTHQGQVYMRRYAVCGWLTGDARASDYLEPPALANVVSRAWDHVTMALLRLRARLPNLYLHQIMNPDADTCLHDHPWPWAVSWVMLGGYTEARQADKRTIEHFKQSGYVWHDTREFRFLKAPALNFLLGDTFHRIAELCRVYAGHVPPPAREMVGTWTLFLAGPRARAKPWGYLVPGQGYVSHRERHEQFGGEEKRGAPIDV